MQLKNILLAAALGTCATNAIAQTGGCNSSYSRFGMGCLSDASSSYNRNMGGTGVALRAGNRVNPINPASYSACDSLTFILDLGMSVSMGSYSTPLVRQNVKNTSLDNVNAMFRVRKGLGMSIGFIPFSSIGYNYSSTQHVGQTELNDKEITHTTAYNGNGGLHNLYAGIGWEPLKGLSIGANLGYVWGTWNHTVVQSYAEGGTTSSVYDGLHTYYMADLKTYKLDAGLQYVMPVSKGNSLTFGLTAGIGHKMAGEANILRTTTNGDTISRVMPKAFDMPWSLGVGVAWTKGNKLTVSADYRQERWGDCRLPQIISGGKEASEMVAEAAKGSMKNRHHIAAGLEYIPDIYNRSYLQRIRYRLGANYSTPYCRVNGADGPKEFSLGFGFGLPVVNEVNNRAGVNGIVNIGFQWVHVEPGALCNITENYFKINIGVTFKEAWFVKWKIR